MPSPAEPHQAGPVDFPGVTHTHEVIMVAAGRKTPEDHSFLAREVKRRRLSRGSESVPRNGCDEALVHGWDSVRGLGEEFAPSAELAERVLRRLFPWAPINGSPWQALLWANARRWNPSW